MAQAILGLKAAYEKAGKDPSPEQIAAALEHLEFDTPSGKIRMAIGKGHQAVEPTVYGRVKSVKGKLTYVDVKQYPAEKVNPPEGVKSADWIKSGFKGSM
jgi:branched-chain amino acid transport system substrate-binding protein